MLSLASLVPLSLVPRDAAPPTSDPLVERLRRGEIAAVAEAYDRHSGAVRAFARRLLADQASAEDLVHEVFLTLPKVIGRFEGQCSLSTYLMSIAVNHARHHVRSAVRKRAAAARLSDEPPPSTRDPEREASRRELALALTRSLDALPVEQRVAFVLCEVEERTSREVAEIVGAPEATVRTRLYHARLKLREMLQKEGFR